MRQTHLFTTTRREIPKDEVARNAQLLIRAGFVHKEMAGSYSYLPLGLRVLNNIIRIIREEMNMLGGQEIHLAALQNKDTWEKSGRWSDDVVDSWFKTKLRNGTELGLGFTHEEPLTLLLKDHVRSFRDLPFSAYQFQTKFRNEERAKSGLLRTREFVMKDLYSFCRTTEEHTEVYEKVKQAYVKIFDRLGLGTITYITYASGGSFAQYSHEFQTLTDAGEDTIYVDEKRRIAVNKEVLTDDVLHELGIAKSDLAEKRSVEVGNIFSLGTRFSETFDLTYTDEKGDSIPIIMGSYGIGPGRVMGTIVETSADTKGLVWPSSIAPYAVHLVSVLDEKGRVKDASDKLYATLTQRGVEVLYDDRECGAGEKFSDADLIGIPTRYVVSEKTLTHNSIETKERATGTMGSIPLDLSGT